MPGISDISALVIPFIKLENLNGRTQLEDFNPKHSTEFIKMGPKIVETSKHLLLLVTKY